MAPPRFSKEELSYYSRQLVLSEIGTNGQRKLRDARVLVAGVGGNAKGLSASLFATPDGSITRCDASGGPPPPSPSSGLGC